MLSRDYLDNQLQWKEKSFHGKSIFDSKRWNDFLPFAPEIFHLQGTSRLAGKPCEPYSTPEAFISRVPQDWRMDLQQIGQGLKFISPDNLVEWRVHAPIFSLMLRGNAPGQQGWVMRITRYDPSHPFASCGKFSGWVSYNTLGQPVPNESNAAHIPVFGNPANYDPLDFD